MVAEPGAPLVVAVVVTCRPGAWLEEALGSLAAQDHPNLSVIVIEVDDGDQAGLADRVAAVLPEARVTRAAAQEGFAGGANKGVEMVEGAVHVLVCHDDVALAPDAVRLLVEEAYRSNAGLTSPKFVLWDAPDHLLAVGMGADRLGVLNPLVEAGDLDQGQHDVVREVFVAPSAAVLVRTDLWRALGGLNPSVGQPGEDLDLSWRAQLAGARVIVAPQARARHLEAAKRGLRPGSAPAPRQPGTPAPVAMGEDGEPVPSRALREKHRLRTLWTCYGLRALVVVVPVVILFALAESFWALSHRRSWRQVALPLVALFASFRHPRDLWAWRRRAQALRRTSDLKLWKSQSRGSARLRALVRLRLERGHELAWAAARAAASDSTVIPGGLGPDELGPDELGPSPVRARSAAGGPGFPDGSTMSVASEAQATGPGPRVSPGRGPGPGQFPRGGAGPGATIRPGAGPGPGAALSGSAGEAAPGARALSSTAPALAARYVRSQLTWRTTAVVAAVVVVFVLVGSRNVLNQPLPLVGQLPSPSGGLGGWWHTWWDGPGAGALSTTAFAPPGLLLMSVVGVLALGSANVAVHILTLAPLVIGPWGTYAQTRQFGSQRGRLAAAIVYAAVPAPYNALASGHWAGLVAYALAPWLIGALFRQGGQAPFPPVSWARAWPRLLALGAAVAIGACLTPAMLLLVPVLGAALLVGSLLAGPGNGGLRFFLAALGATVVAYLALAPWSFEIMRSWSSALGSPSGGEHPLSLSQLLRLQTGPFGGGPLAWAVVGAAVVPLVIGRAWRLAFAVRLWTVAATCLGLVWAGSRGWVPVPQLEFLMAPAGAALALAAAAGAAAIEVDLSGYRFGWRQAAPAVAALAVATATLPAISWAAGGQWGLPASGAEGAFAFPSAAGPGDYRTLWLGDASSLPLAAQGSVQGVAFATSLDGLPSTEELWSPGPSQLSSVVQADLGWAAAGETIALGHLLAPLAVRYVVVPLSGGPGPTLADLVLSLDRQSDLVPVGTDPSYAVFANSAWAPVFSVLAPGERLPPATGAWSVAYALQRLDLASAEGVQAGAAAGQSAVAGTGVKGQAVIFGAVSPGAWQLRAGGRDVPSQPALGFATTWTLPQGTKQVVISRRGASGQRDVDLAMLVVWLMALWAVWPRLRAKLETQLTLVNLDRGRPGTDVAEIDWSQALEGQSLG